MTTSRLAYFFAVIVAVGAMLRSELHAGFEPTAADRAFESVASASIDDYLRSEPIIATQLGDHRFDEAVSDRTPAGEAATVALYTKHLRELAAIDAQKLTGPNRVDFQLLQLRLESALFRLTELRGSSWDPLSYNDNLVNGVYALMKRDYAPAEQRLRSAAKRLGAFSQVIAQAKENLKNPPEVYTQVAIKQVKGGIGFVHEGLEPLLAVAPSLRAELAPVQDQAAKVLADYAEWLEKDLLPRSHGEFRIGPDLYRKSLHYSLGSDLSPEALKARAKAELITVTDILYATALPLYKKYFTEANADSTIDKTKVIKAVLDKISEDRPDDGTMVAAGEIAIRQATDFVREHDLATLPAKPVKLIVTPEFRRGRGIAYCDSPGALESGGETFVAFEPTPSEWPEGRKTSFYREYNSAMMRDLLVHEAMPGHFLQIAHSNEFKAPTRVRALCSSGTFIEGWAVYTERVMAEAGFGGPETHLQQLKMRLRVIINTLLDIGVHTEGMTKEGALDLMMKQGFQEEGEAVAKWQRAQLSYGQLATYFVGAAEHDDMRAAAEKKLGAKFNLKQYHDAVLAHGSPAVRFVREEIGW